MIFYDVIYVYCERYTEHKNATVWAKRSFWMMKQEVQMLTTALLKG
jgi:hypothetical protein